MIEITSLSRQIRATPWRLSLLHGTPYARLLWLTHGQARVLHGARLRGTGVHNFILIPPRHPFALEAGVGTNGHLVHVLDHPRGIWPNTPLLLRIRDGAAQSEISALFDAILREKAAQRSLVEDAIGAHLDLMAIWLRRQLEHPDSVPPAPTAADNLTTAFLLELEHSYATGASMAAYARLLGVSPTHLARVTKAQFGRSAAELISERVLHAAREELELGERPAKDIAALLGFGSAAAFSRFVRSGTGHSPRALRKMAPASLKPT